MKKVPVARRRGNYRKTIDEGKFEEELKTRRRTIFIQQKLEVVNYWKKLRKEKKECEETVQEPRPVMATRAELVKFFQAKKEARKKLKNNLQKLCREKFPDLVRKCSVVRWVRTAEEELWEQLPDSIRSRSCETSNEWRRKIGAPLKGRKEGGTVPWILQKELDMLMVEASSGLSDVTERKEMVTVENVVPWLHQKIQTHLT